MNYGYALLYKDKEGFEIPYLEHDGSFRVFTDLKTAENYHISKRIDIAEQMTPRKTETKTGFLWWKKTHVVVSHKITDNTKMLYTVMLNTMFIKKVKVA